MHNNNSPISASSDSAAQSPKSFFPRDRKRRSKKAVRKKGMINPSLTYAEYNFLKDLANNTVDGDKYSDGYKRLLKHKLRHKFPAVMEMANMMTKVKEEKKI